jgi:hypothetical protein
LSGFQTPGSPLKEKGKEFRREGVRRILQGRNGHNGEDVGIKGKAKEKGRSGGVIREGQLGISKWE